MNVSDMELTQIGIYIILMLVSTRWAFLVSYKIPAWLNADWKNQAQDFLEINPPSPAPSFRWWTPKYIRSVNSNFYWIPIIGPYLDKSYTQAVFEFLALPLGYLLCGLPVEFGFFFVFFYGFLLSLSLIDLKTMLLPDLLVYPLLWLGLLKACFDTQHCNLYLIGAISGYLLLYILQQFFHILFKKDGMGGGDLKLLAAIGAWVGVNNLPYVLIIACVTSILFFVIFKITKKIIGKDNVFPFGPSLAVGGLLVYLLMPVM